VVVVLAAGNEGFARLVSDGGELDANMDLSIGDPANLDEAICVGSVHKEKPHTYGISYFSSRGPTADGRQKPDVVAPGERILSCRHKPLGAGKGMEELYLEMSGTSMAAPHVSGMLAAFLGARREFIGYPNKVKQILLDNCTDLKRDRNHQGAGLPNLVRMLVAT
jgi:subtilisin family serine protease